ncbi:Glutaredoxin [Coemansia sp. RSA 486]|nr:Glutaredoxin [Coemansia sp. RSA 486]
MGSALSSYSSNINTEMNAATKLVKTFIKDNNVMVFSKSYCPYCRDAKSALEERNIKFMAIELDKRKDGGAIQQALQELTGQRTVPNIFAKGYHIGGCDNTLAALKSNKFQEKLSSAKVGPFALVDNDSSKASTSTESAAPSPEKAQL